MACISLRKVYQDLTSGFKNDGDGHLNFNMFNVMGDFTILGYYGKGTFGKVIRAIHTPTHQEYAIKIVTIYGRQQGLNEIDVLIRTRRFEAHKESKFLIQLVDAFEFNNHVCIVLEPLGLSLRQFLIQNNRQPFLLGQIREIGYQLCYATLMLHANTLIHADLKPENICFVNSDFSYGFRETRQKTNKIVKDTQIRIIDLGNIATADHAHTFKCQTVYYRAPEVTFGPAWSRPCDIWSIGCILFELYTGNLLFPADCPISKKIVFQEVLGPFPPELFDPQEKKESDPELPSKPFVQPEKRKPLKRYMKQSSKEHVLFFDLLSKMLIYSQNERINALDSCKHPFFFPLFE